MVIPQHEADHDVEEEVIAEKLTMLQRVLSGRNRRKRSFVDRLLDRFSSSVNSSVGHDEFRSFCIDGICVVDGEWSSCGALSLGFVLIRWQEQRNTCWPR